MGSLPWREPQKVERVDVRMQRHTIVGDRIQSSILTYPYTLFCSDTVQPGLCMGSPRCIIEGQMSIFYSLTSC